MIRPNTAEFVSNATKHGDHCECRAAYLCVTSESSRPGIARVPWSAGLGCWKMFTVAKPVGSQTNASIP